MSALFTPLTDDEFEELGRFLLDEVDSDERMLIDTLDGYLHCIAAGPISLHPNQWLPNVWGIEEMIPETESPTRLFCMLNLIARHLNSIVFGLESNPRTVAPSWGWEYAYDRQYLDAEGWAMGFVEGVNLCWNDWQPFLNSPAGLALIRPIGLLGVADFDPKQAELTKSPLARDHLARQIPSAILDIYAYWLPRRKVIHKLSTPAAMSSMMQ